MTKGSVPGWEKEEKTFCRQKSVKEIRSATLQAVAFTGGVVGEIIKSKSRKSEKLSKISSDFSAKSERENRGGLRNVKTNLPEWRNQRSRKEEGSYWMNECHNWGGESLIENPYNKWKRKININREGEQQSWTIKLSKMSVRKRFSSFREGSFKVYIKSWNSPTEHLQIKISGISGFDFTFSGIPTKQSYQVAFQGGICR